MKKLFDVNFIEKIQYLKDLSYRFLEKLKVIVFNILNVIKRDKGMLIGIVVCVVVMISSLFLYSGTNTEGQVLSQLQKAIKNKNSVKLSKIIRADDEKINSSDLIPLIRYFTEGSGNIIEEIDELEDTGVSSLFRLKVDNGFIIDKHYISINKVAMSLTTNVETAVFKINGKKINKELSINSLIPGLYDLTYSLNTEYGKLEDVKSEEILHNTMLNIDIPVSYINIHSNYDDAKVFIDGKDTNKIVSEVKDFGPVPQNKGIKIYIEKKFPWGNIKSEDFEIKDENYFKIDIDIANDQVMDDVKSIIETFFQSVFIALNNRDKALIKAGNDDVKEKIYNNIEKKTFLFKNNYEISDVELKIDNTEFDYKDEIYRANVVVDVSYSIAKKIFKFNDKNYEDLFLVTLNYYDGQWHVEEVQRLNFDT